MGIDIYMNWRGQTPEENNAQITGFSITAGKAGYLRESYHGGPYATRFLVQESFDESWYDKASEAERENYQGQPIPAVTLRQRLPATIFLTLARDALVYGGDPSEHVGGVINLGAAGTEDAIEDSVEILDHPEIKRTLAGIFTDIAKMRDGSLEYKLAANLVPEQVKALEMLIERRHLPDYALAFVDFVRLAELKEKETGEPVWILASY